MSNRSFLQEDNSFNEIALNWLRNGYFPRSSLELAQINAFLEDSKSTLAKYDEEIANDTAEDFAYTTDLRMARNLLISYMANAQALTSAVRKIPADVLCEIFELVLSTDGNPQYDNVTFHLKINFSSPTCPTTVTTRPAWWSSIFVDTSVLQIWPKKINLFLRHISLSANAPLTFVVSGMAVADSPSFHVLDTLLDHSFRWHRAYLRIVGPDCLPFIERKMCSILQTGSTQETSSEYLPNLKFLDAGRTQLPAKLLSFGCSKLQTFKVSSRLSWSTFSHYSFTEQLRTFEVGAPFGTDFLVDFICRMPLLEEFSICGRSGVYVLINAFETGASVEVDTALNPYHSKITTLSVSLGWLWPGAWTRLRLPHLRTLTITCKEGWLPPHQILRELSEMLCQSNSVLQNLAFKDVPSDDAITFLASHPSVSHLTYTARLGLEVPIPGYNFGYCVYDGLFHSLGAARFIPNDVDSSFTTSSVAPNLHTLHIHNDSRTATKSHCHDYSDYWDSLSHCHLLREIPSMIQSRLRIATDATEPADVPESETTCRLLEAPNTQRPELRTIVLGKGFGCHRLVPLGVTFVVDESM
ncbi:hypothetical protein BT96DRAFT_913914 [Gymnopus androsaceus JB14]|uniref:Uncharacterized protein n=1 Tax=Gymnopus androsaceus JB14 TaxID=1447944 RepID=A0A6A4IF09_9AGAR|nr:hypothetical protein BT96DRAFT_913914 [Gymnopus androsaceus JB14]